MLNKTYATINTEDFFKDISELNLKCVDSGISKSLFISKNNEYNVEIEALKTINFTIQFSFFISCAVKGKDRLLKPTYYFITMEQDLSLDEGFCQINVLTKYLFNKKNRNEIKDIRALYFKDNKDVTEDFINGKIKEKTTSISNPTRECLKNDLKSFNLKKYETRRDLLAFLSKDEKHYIEVFPNYNSSHLSRGTDFIVNIVEYKTKYQTRETKPNLYKIRTLKPYDCLFTFFQKLITESNEKNIDIEAIFFKDNKDITKQLIEKNNIINKVKNF